jgi:branched-subunit amino acid ABC-type transport system permease component
LAVARSILVPLRQLQGDMIALAAVLGLAEIVQGGVRLILGPPQRPFAPADLGHEEVRRAGDVSARPRTT